MKHTVNTGHVMQDHLLPSPQTGTREPGTQFISRQKYNSKYNGVNCIDIALVTKNVLALLLCSNLRIFVKVEEIKTSFHIREGSHWHLKSKL